MPLPCPSCGARYESDRLEELRPGRQFCFVCPSCGYEARGGVGFPAQQGMPQHSHLQGLMSTPNTPDWEDALARSQLPPVRI